MLFQTLNNFDIPQQKKHKRKDSDPFPGNISVETLDITYSNVFFVNEVKNISIQISNKTKKCSKAVQKKLLNMRIPGGFYEDFAKRD